MRVMTLSLLLTLAACQSWTAFEQNSPDWVGVYKGVVPCADCEGIETTLRLTPDGTYELSLKYLGKSTTPFLSKGSFKWRQDGRALELLTSSEAPRFYRVEENRLRQLDARGQPIESALADKYVLRRL